MRRLGRGGTASVYEAIDDRIGKRVALKVLHRHPHVVAVYVFGEHEGASYLAMELLEGIDLRTHLDRSGALPLDELSAIAMPILAGVAAAHDVATTRLDVWATSRRAANAIVPSHALEKRSARDCDDRIDVARRVLDIQRCRSGTQTGHLGERAAHRRSVGLHPPCDVDSAPRRARIGTAA